MYVPLINVAIKTVLLHGSTTGKHVKKGKKKGSATYFFLFLEEVEELSCRPSSCIQKQHKVSREQGWDRKKNTKQQPSVPNHHKEPAVPSLPSFLNVGHSHDRIQQKSMVPSKTVQSILHG